MILIDDVVRRTESWSGPLLIGLKFKLMWIDSITWESFASEGKKLPEQEIHLWLTQVSSFLKEKEALKRLLSDEEKKRGERFHFRNDQDKFTISRGILRVLLSLYTGISPRELEILQDSAGKPSIAKTDLQFNLSHSSDFILYGLSKVGRIGVDIEKVKEDIEAEKLSQRYFTHDEFQMIQNVSYERRAEIFFKLWTCKEAILKMKGIGLQGELNQVEVANFEKKEGLFVFAPSAQYMGAVAVEGEVSHIKFYRTDEKFLICRGGPTWPSFPD